ncbi:MAG: ABC transporter permease subunit, partial [Neofamilia sp.]
IRHGVKKITDVEGIEKIGASDLYSIVLTKKGTIKVWGATMPTGLNAINSKYDGQVKDFEVASTNMLVLLKDGSVVTFGQKGSEIDTAKPEILKEAGDVNIVEIGRMRYSAIAVTDEGENIIWGARADGAYNIPEMEGTVIKAETGREHITVLTDAGKVYSWGKNNYGSLDYPTGDGYVDVFSGYFNNYAIKEDGSIDTWGLDGFLMGSDEQGRDLFTRLVHGGKMTLLIALVAVVIQVILGVIIGVISGYYGGWIDNILNRFGEIVSSFPFYPLVITLSALLPVDIDQYQRLIMIMIILGLLGWPSIARLVRGEILSEREKDYITAAKALGLKEHKIMMSHIVPNILSIIIVRATLGYASSLLTEAGLSFLGFGVQNPFPSWGNMLTASNNITALEFYWWRWVFPGAAVFLTALTVNLMGDALRDAMDPKALER